VPCLNETLSDVVRERFVRQYPLRKKTREQQTLYDAEQLNDFAFTDPALMPEADCVRVLSIAL
jgi:hypothetical protein